MEFNNSVLNQQKSGQPNVGRPAHPGEKRPRRRRSKWLNIASIILLVAIVLLVGSLVLLTSTSKTQSEASIVNTNKFQAVFLNGGQVYFGKIQAINNDYLTLDNIYYLKVSGQSGADTNQTTENPQDVSLARLGCELHGPEDKMIISKSQVMFWENLKDDGQVTKAISEFVKQNPNGQKCSEPTTKTPSN